MRLEASEVISTWNLTPEQKINHQNAIERKEEEFGIFVAMLLERLPNSIYALPVFLSTIMPTFSERAVPPQDIKSNG
jgi:hypothetical protein